MTAEFGPSPARTSVPSQRGIVLFVALIMLVIISLMAVMIVRNATSSEDRAAGSRANTAATSWRNELNMPASNVLTNVHSSSDVDLAMGPRMTRISGKEDSLTATFLLREIRVIRGHES